MLSLIICLFVAGDYAGVPCFFFSLFAIEGLLGIMGRFYYSNGRIVEMLAKSVSRSGLLWIFVRQLGGK